MNKGTERSVAMVIVLSIVTCSIYLWVWLYQVSDELRIYLEDESINPGLDVLLSIITCGIYLIYWMYRAGKKINEAQLKAGLPGTDDSILYLILSIFGFAIISQAIIQSKLNEIWNA